MDLVTRHDVIEDVFTLWPLGAARAAYSGHAYRVLNYSRRILGSSREDEMLAVASAFHDIGIWTDGTFDYLPPSIVHARSFVEERLPHLPADTVHDIIANHHVLRRIQDGASAATIESFRLADRVDVSGGLLGAGLDAGFRREVTRAFPYSGFHGVLLRTGLRWMLRHPLRPLPMLRLSPSTTAVVPRPTTRG